MIRTHIRSCAKQTGLYNCYDAVKHQPNSVNGDGVRDIALIEGKRFFQQIEHFFSKMHAHCTHQTHTKYSNSHAHKTQTLNQSSLIAQTLKQQFMIIFEFEVNKIALNENISFLSNATQKYYNSIDTYG